MKCAIIPVTPYQQNCSVLLCEATKEIAIIDPGGDLPLIRKQIAEMGGKPAIVLLTHGHMDHCAQARVLADELGVPLEGPHKGDKFWLDQLPMACQMVGFPPSEAFVPDRWLDDGDSVGFGDVKLEVLHCPGHTPGHIIFFNPEVRLAMVGDVIFQGSVGRTDFPGGDFDTLVNSIKQKLFPLGDDVTFIPGHGPTSTLGEERRTNPFVSGTYR